MPEFPRLRWLLLLQLTAIGAATLDTGSIIDALASAGILAPGIVSLVLFVFRLGGAFLQIDTHDEFVHTMSSGRKVARPGLWELVW